MKQRGQQARKDILPSTSPHPLYAICLCRERSSILVCGTRYCECCNCLAIRSARGISRTFTESTPQHHTARARQQHAAAGLCCGRTADIYARGGPRRPPWPVAATWPLPLARCARRLIDRARRARAFVVDPRARRPLVVLCARSPALYDRVSDVPDERCAPGADTYPAATRAPPPPAAEPPTRRGLRQSGLRRRTHRHMTRGHTLSLSHIQLMSEDIVCTFTV